MIYVKNNKFDSAAIEKCSEGPKIMNSKKNLNLPKRRSSKLTESIAKRNLCLKIINSEKFCKLCLLLYTVPKEIDFSRFNMKCSRENVILRGIIHVQ